MRIVVLWSKYEFVKLRGIWITSARISQILSTARKKLKEEILLYQNGSRTETP